MLRDRRVLIERELELAKDRAAHSYLAIVAGCDDPLNQQYEQLRTRAENLQFDLDMVNQLIAQGHK